MNFNVKQDREFIDAMLQRQYGIKLHSLKPVTMSFKELQEAISPGKTAFYGTIQSNSASAQTHTTSFFAAWLLKFKGKAKFELYPELVSASAPLVLFDDLWSYNHNLGLIYNYDGPILNGRSVSLFSAHVGIAALNYNVSFLTFNGYEINIGH